MTATSLVDDALDYMDAAAKSNGERFDHFTVDEIAPVLGEPNWQASHMLQQHRIGQRRRNARWIIAGEGYGRSAFWNVLARPGTDRASARLNRKQAALWSLRDAVRRAMRDAASEIKAATAASGSTTTNTTIDNVIDTAIGVFDLQVDLAESIIVSLP